MQKLEDILYSWSLELEDILFLMKYFYKLFFYQTLYLCDIYYLSMEHRETVFETIIMVHIKYFYFNYCYASIDNFFFHFSSRFS